MHKKLKFSKNSDFYFTTKKDFFVNNSSLLQKAIEVNQMYLKQPKRTNCKICNSKLSKKIDINIFGIGYVFAVIANILMVHMMIH
jgi:uncharacterized protein with PIN domain